MSSYTWLLYKPKAEIVGGKPASIIKAEGKLEAHSQDKALIRAYALNGGKEVIEAQGLQIDVFPVSG